MPRPERTKAMNDSFLTQNEQNALEEYNRQINERQESSTILWCVTFNVFLFLAITIIGVICAVWR